MNKIFIIISFNERDYVQGLNLTQEWIDYRIDIFMRYTYISLMNQTCQDYTCLIKYQQETKSLIEKSLSRYQPLSNHFHFVTKNDMNQTINKELINKSYDNIIMTHIDSDDMYHKAYIEKLLNYKPKPQTKYLINQKGYIYDSINDKLGHWFCHFPTFYAYVYKIDDYQKGIRYKIDGRKIENDDAYEIIGENNYLIIYHHSNTVTNFANSRMKGLISDKHEISRVMNQFFDNGKENVYE